MIIAGKYEGYFQFFRALINNLTSFPLEKDYYLIPVPLTKRKFLQRGFNQAEIICQVLKEKFGFKILNCLEKVKETKDQAKLSFEERQKNLLDAFSLKFKPGPIKALLVDDVLTTGATLTECAKVLRKEKIKKLGAFVILA